MARGLQDISFRIPEEWSASWFLEFIRDVLTKLDVRNAIEGAGITIDGTPNEVATISSSEDLLDLIEQNFILATSSSFLDNERVLQGETGIISIVDEGPGRNIIVKLINGTVPLSKLAPIDAQSVVGNNFATPAVPAPIISETDNTFLVRRSDVLRFDGLVDADIPAEIARDTEVATAISDHEAAADPHPNYLLEADAASTYQPINAALGFIFRGAGDPEGVVTADIGSLYLRSDGGTGTSLYVKEADDAANTGWQAK